MSTGAVPPPSTSTALRRSGDDRIVAGVCGGIARELHVDPLVVRIIAVVLAAAGGIGALAYVVAVLIVPADGEQDPLLRRAIDGQERLLAAGLVLLALPLWAIVSDGWFLGLGHGWGFGWLVVVGLGVLLYVRHTERRRETGTSDGAAPDVAPLAAPADDDPDSDAVEAPTLVQEPVAPPPAPPSRSGGRIALGATLIGIGVVGAVGAIAGDGVRWDVLLACAVIVAGAVLVIAAPFGGARALIPLGLVLATVTGIAAAADLDLRGGVGERHYTPATAGELRTEYHLAAGQMTLDLRDVEFPDGATRVAPEMGFGELIVRLPRTVRAEVDAHVAGGEIEALGREGNGMDTDVHVPPVAGTGPLVQVDARVGFGHIAVVRGNDAVPRGPRGDTGGPGIAVLGGLR